jgi:hypothetical protein
MTQRQLEIQHAKTALAGLDELSRQQAAEIEALVKLEATLPNLVKSLEEWLQVSQSCAGAVASFLSIQVARGKVAHQSLRNQHDTLAMQIRAAETEASGIILPTAKM